MSFPYIYPHATGTAAETVKTRQEKQDVVLYAGWFCPFAQRVWITLEEKGIPYQYVEVDPNNKPEHFVVVNPRGLIPAIEHKGKGLYESLILCEYIEDAFASHAPKLLPEDPLDKAYARIWIDYIARPFFQCFIRLLQAQGLEKQKEALEELTTALRTIAQEIKGPYFLGDQFSLIDITIAPWIQRDWVLAEHRGFSRESVSLEWKKYADLVEKRETVLKTKSDKEHFIPIYARYLQNEAESVAAKAVRDGKPAL